MISGWSSCAVRRAGNWGRGLQSHNVSRPAPGIALATTFAPFLRGAERYSASANRARRGRGAISLGAGLQNLFVALCRIEMGVCLYGVLLCTRRGDGAFGAVSVVSGHIRGETNDNMPHVMVEISTTNINTNRPRVASLLAMLALSRWVEKTFLDKTSARPPHDIESKMD